MTLFKFDKFLESKNIIIDNKEDLTKEELNIIADIIKYFDSEAKIDGENGWEKVIGYITKIDNDEIHLSIDYDFKYSDGEIDHHLSKAVIDRKSKKWTHEPVE